MLAKGRSDIELALPGDVLIMGGTQEKLRRELLSVEQTPRNEPARGRSSIRPFSCRNLPPLSERAAPVRLAENSRVAAI